MDESGLHLNNKPEEVIAERGSKNIAAVTSGEKGKTITIISRSQRQFEDAGEEVLDATENTFIGISKILPKCDMVSEHDNKNETDLNTAKEEILGKMLESICLEPSTSKPLALKNQVFRQLAEILTSPGNIADKGLA
ncbi:hypothetical protein ILUMI_16352 [Ignelater luminosus]|uniref:Uncharacterized protein n=1 Tax=Ignelater luminosus TaxID=2038154 RepID=A0A8K0CQH7_IGNLU|nr:hypothetical protein ILUMI_16352 [Ignelater luminosus]